MQFYSPLTVIVGHNGSGKTVRSSASCARTGLAGGHRRSAASACDLREPEHLSSWLTLMGTLPPPRPSLSASSTRPRATSRPVQRAEPSFMTPRCVHSFHCVPSLLDALPTRLAPLFGPERGLPQASLACARLSCLCCADCRTLSRLPASTRSRPRSSSASTTRARRRCSSSGACRSPRRRPSRACR